MSMNAGRVASFERNTDLESLLSELNNLLEPAEERALALVAGTEQPLILVVGAPRSGTTLLMQWLAASGVIAYPTNMLSRFYRAPAIGARIQQLLMNPRYSFRDELAGLASPVDFSSDLGKTVGPLAPNEFWYFWRRFLPTTDIEPLGAQVDETDFKGLRESIAGLGRVFNQPLAMKGMMVQYDIAAFARALPTAIFLHVQRDAAANARSLLSARAKFFGDATRWYSAKPPEYAELCGLEPAEQVVGQVVHTNRHILEACDQLPADRWLNVSYGEFCAAPQLTWAALCKRLAAQGCELPSAHPGPTQFTPTRTRAADATDGIDRALSAYSRKDA